MNGLIYTCEVASCAFQGQTPLTKSTPCSRVYRLPERSCQTASGSRDTWVETTLPTLRSCTIGRSRPKSADSSSSGSWKPPLGVHSDDQRMFEVAVLLCLLEYVLLEGFTIISPPEFRRTTVDQSVAWTRQDVTRGQCQPPVTAPYFKLRIRMQAPRLDKRRINLLKPSAHLTLDTANLTGADAASPWWSRRAQSSWVSRLLSRLRHQEFHLREHPRRSRS